MNLLNYFKSGSIPISTLFVLEHEQFEEFVGVGAADLGERTLPLFAPFNAFLRPLTPHRLAGKRCQSGVGRFLKVFGRVKPKHNQTKAVTFRLSG